jgi:hypothetical protein
MEELSATIQASNRARTNLVVIIELRCKEKAQIHSKRMLDGTFGSVDLTIGYT